MSDAKSRTHRYRRANTGATHWKYASPRGRCVPRLRPHPDDRPQDAACILSATGSRYALTPPSAAALALLRPPPDRCTGSSGPLAAELSPGRSHSAAALLTCSTALLRVVCTGTARLVATCETRVPARLRRRRAADRVRGTWVEVFGPRPVRNGCWAFRPLRFLFADKPAIGYCWASCSMPVICRLVGRSKPRHQPRRRL